MDSREFDDLIKDSLNSFSQLPDKGIEKAVFGKVFFQNIWVFHKLKLMSSILLICGGATFSYYMLNEDSSLDTIAVSQIQDTILNDENDLSENKLSITDNDQFSITDQPISSEIIESDKMDESLSNNENKLVQDNKLSEEDKQDASSSKMLTINAFDSNDVVISKNQEKNEVNNIIENDINNEKINLSDTDLSKSNLETQKKAHESNEKSTINTNIISEDLEKQDVKILDEQSLKLKPLNIVALHTCMPNKDIKDVPVLDPSDYANEAKKRGFSFDAYFSPYNQSDIDNILSQTYQDYWWDFYKEYDMENSGFGAGVNLSYNYNNFKINSGFNFDQIHDYKPMYQYFSDVDSIFAFSSGNGNVYLLSVENISGLEVYGDAADPNQDTAVILYVDPNDDNLLSEINRSSNRYNYLRIPLTIGYEITLKRASFELNAGVEYTRLIQANGISYKNGYVDVGIRPHPYYFYDDMVATTCQNHKSSFRMNNWNYVANVITRVRLSNAIDLFTSFRFQYNTNNIMSDDYLLEKTYKKYGVNVGITYHLNPRLSLKETTAPKFN